jgi:hypothetical protein
MTRRGSRVIISIVVALVGFLGWGGYQVLRGFGQGYFPEIAPGLYAGSLECDGGTCSMPLLVEKQAQLRELAVFVGDERVPAQRAVTQDPSGRTKLPLIVAAQNLRLKLVGEARGIERYQGTFVDPINATQGTWKLEKRGDERLDPVQETAIRNWYAAWMSLQANEGKIQELQQEYQQQTRKIEKLNGSLLDDDTLRRKADQRLGSASSALESVQDELTQVRQELESALRNVELAQRVSSRGNLVLMSRESIQREARWIEISLNLFAPETAPGFEESLERAYRVQQLKDEIAQEREKLYREDTKRRYGGESSETRTEEEFYHEAR